jgi:hypothetical protein
MVRQGSNDICDYSLGIASRTTVLYSELTGSVLYAVFRLFSYVLDGCFCFVYHLSSDFHCSMSIFLLPH